MKLKHGGFWRYCEEAREEKPWIVVRWYEMPLGRRHELPVLFVRSETIARNAVEKWRAEGAK
jgi:hypothetical protein